MSLLEVTNLKKIYTTRFGGNKVQALTNVNFSVEKGEFVAIMGESGSGKTTLLNILATLDKPTSGDVLLDGKSLGHLSDKEISTFRRKNLGFVFQDFNLLDTFSLRDNIYLRWCWQVKITGKWGRKSVLLHRLFIFMSCWKNILMSLWRTETKMCSCQGSDHTAAPGPCG